MSALVSTQMLASQLTSPDVRILDASWFMPDSGRNARAEHAAAHIPNAQYFDIDEIADDKSELPHTLPPAPKFSIRMRKLGIGDGIRVIVYDNNNFLASARVWWLFRLFGHEDVAVLDGGLKKWRADGGPIEDLPRTLTERHFTARQNNLLLRELDQMRRNVAVKTDQVVDARSSARFHGTVPEPREGVRAGHIPGSANLPYSELLDTESGTLKPRDELAQQFDLAGIDTSGTVVTTCGSGVSAAVLNLALFELGNKSAAMYDGSWTEWGSQPDTPVAR